ncbi:unnamed protein product [Closterium sp. NIES-54]
MAPQKPFLLSSLLSLPAAGREAGMATPCAPLLSPPLPRFPSSAAAPFSLPDGTQLTRRQFLGANYWKGFRPLVERQGRQGVSGGEFERTWGLVRQAVAATGLHPHEGISSLLISGLCVNGQLDRAMDVLEEMQQMGFTLTPRVFDPLLLQLARSKLFKEALALADVMRRMDGGLTVASFSSLIEACLQIDNLSAAMGVLREMMAEGIRPNVVVFTQLLHGCALARNRAMGMRVNEMMQQHGVPPNDYLHAAMVELHHKTGDVNGAMEVWIGEGWRVAWVGVECAHPNDYLHAAMVELHHKTGDVNGAMEPGRVFGLCRLPPNDYLHAAMVELWGNHKTGDVNGAMEVCILNPPPNPPPNFLPTPSQPPPTSPPAPFPLPPPYQYLAAAEAAGHKVGANAVSALVEALAAAGRTEAALAAFHRGRAQGVQPLPYAVGTMIMALGRAGKVEEMMALFRESRRGARGARRVQGCFQKGDRWTRGSGGEGEDGGDGGKGEGGEGGRQWEGVTWQQEMRSGHALVVQTLACLVQLHDVQYGPCSPLPRSFPSLPLALPPYLFPSLPTSCPPSQPLSSHLCAFLLWPLQNAISSAVSLWL